MVTGPEIVAMASTNGVTRCSTSVLSPGRMGLVLQNILSDCYRRRNDSPDGRGVPAVPPFQVSTSHLYAFPVTITYALWLPYCYSLFDVVTLNFFTDTIIHFI